jgi:hypothetical protein
MTNYSLIIISLLLFIVCLNSSGQETDSTKDKGVKIILDCRPYKALGDPLFIFLIDRNKGEFTMNEIFTDSLKISPEWIISINVLKGQEALDKYGIRGQYGAILIDLKKESFDKLPADIKAKFRKND